MKDDLERLLTNPFEILSSPARDVASVKKSATAPKSASKWAHITDNHNIFLEPPTAVLKIHIDSANLLEQKFTDSSLPLNVQSFLTQHLSQLKASIDEIKHAFSAHIESAVEDKLEKEARRLERRNHRDSASPEKREFIKLKRYYEKVKSFNETIKKSWQEIQNLIQTLSVLPEAQETALTMEKDVLESVLVLIRQTVSFLDALKFYLVVDSENFDPSKGICQINIQFRPAIHYTLRAFLGIAEEPEVEEEAPPNMIDVPLPESKQLDGSIAKNIVIESQERRLNPGGLFYIPLLGSRDWNRTPDYALEITVQEYDTCLEKLKRSYHVNVDPENIQGPLPPAAAENRIGSGEQLLVPYIALLQKTIQEITHNLITVDFPGLDKPLIFLYFCGPHVIYACIMTMLKEQQIGEIFYLGPNRNTVRAYPEDTIKKELIDWWQNEFKTLSGEDVDSYLTYSRIIEMIKKDYRALYEEGNQLYKKEHPGVSYTGREKWLRENRFRIFGLRKTEVYKRFIPGTILN